MKNKFFIFLSLFAFFASFSLIPIFASNDITIESLYDEKADDKYCCYLNFESIVSYEDNYVCTVFYNYKEIPNISSNGNIGYEVLEKTIEFTKIRLLFQDDKEGVLCFRFAFNSEIEDLYIYSSKGENNEYGVSSVSLDSAKRLVNNLCNQEYMDNDESPALYVPMSSNSAKRKTTRNYTGNGRVYGQLKWTDDNGIVHPLVGIKVKLTFLDSYNNVYQYTDSNGNYDITFKNIVGYTNFKCILHIYTVNDYVVIKDNLDKIYEYVEVLPMENNSIIQYNHVFGRFTDAYDKEGKMLFQPIYIYGAIQIYEAMYNYSNYAINLSGDTDLPKCALYYPMGNKPNTDIKLKDCYYNDDNVIYLCSESNREKNKTNCKNTIDGYYPYVEGSWDLIGHEYGHHLQKIFFHQDYDNGEHSTACNDIFKYMENHNYSNPISDLKLYEAKVEGCKLAFCEAWPTFFAISAQQSFNDDAKTVPTVGDYYYQAYSGVCDDLTSINNENDRDFISQRNGESDELIIMSFLYRIWETRNTASWDEISLTDDIIWNVMLKNPTNLSEFINYLMSDTSINISSYKLGKILTAFHLAPYLIYLSFDGDNHLLSFERGNFNVSYPLTGTSVGYQFNNNELYIEFYDDNDNLITNQYFDLGQTETSNNFTYVLSNSSWNRILDIQTLGYYVKITAYAKRTCTVLGETVTHKTGPYIAYERFIKPTNYSITLNDSRYYEKAVTIPAGGSFVFNVTDNIGGYKLFQTFGNMNAEMELYNSSGVLLASSKNDGFSNNPLIHYNISANTTYIINVKLKDETATGLVKLSIIPCRGDLNSNSTTIENESDIYCHNSNSNYNTYVPQYDSTVIRWKPAKTGYYALVLMSNFDSYLYVINPESPDVLIGDVDYNDDFVYDEDNALYDEDSTLYGHYDSDKTYLIVIGKKYIYEPGANISVRFDFFFEG